MASTLMPSLFIVTGPSRRLGRIVTRSRLAWQAISQAAFSACTYGSAPGLRCIAANTLQAVYGMLKALLTDGGPAS